MAVLKEYRKREEEFLRRAKDLDETTALRDAEKQKYDALRKQRLDGFMAGFSTISLRLKEMYQVSIVMPLILLPLNDTHRRSHSEEMLSWNSSIVWIRFPRVSSSVLCRPRRVGEIFPICLEAKRCCHLTSRHTY